MGYSTSVDGEITITPPLAWNEIKDSPFLTNPGYKLGVVLKVTEETVDTDEGQLTRKTSSVLVPAWEDAFKAYSLVEDVQGAIDAFPGHTFTGRLDCEGEENADLWRVVIRDSRAVKVVPEIVWPDDAE